jgi:hypothetical protein
MVIYYQTGTVVFFMGLLLFLIRYNLKKQEKDGRK